MKNHKPKNPRKGIVNSEGKHDFRFRTVKRFKKPLEETGKRSSKPTETNPTPGLLLAPVQPGRNKGFIKTIRSMRVAEFPNLEAGFITVKDERTGVVTELYFVDPCFWSKFARTKDQTGVQVDFANMEYDCNSPCGAVKVWIADDLKPVA